MFTEQSYRHSCVELKAFEITFCVNDARKERIIGHQNPNRGCRSQLNTKNT